MSFLKNLRKKRKTLDIVDFGCGRPRYTNLSKNANWIYLDKEPKHPEVKYSSNRDIPVKDADLFMAIEVLEYLDTNNIKYLLEEATRIVKERKGTIILSAPYLCPIEHNELIRIADSGMIQKFLDRESVISIESFGNMFSIIHDTVQYSILNNIFPYSSKRKNNKILFLVRMILMLVITPHPKNIIFNLR